jgi:hypothetical protein
MKNKKYLKAAKMLVYDKEKYNQDDGCCNVLDWSGQCDSNFHNIFKPEGAQQRDAYFGLIDDPENHLARSLALLFMYEMGEL